MNVTERLRALSEEIARLRTEGGILDEQIAFQQEVAEDARIRAVVSETPLADREAREAAGDLTLLERSRAEVQADVQGLRAEQDRLLEALAEEQRAL